MKNMVVGIVVAWCIMSCQAAHSVGPEPTCANCPGTYISANELSEYLQKAIAERRIDQQVRDVDIGKARVAIGFVHRGKLDAPLPYSVAEHDQVSEVYHVIDGSGTLVLGPDLIDKKRRPADDPIVRFINGPAIMPRLFAMERATNLRLATSLLFRPVQDTGSPGLMTMSTTL
jgi:hypothetical protein